MKVNNRAFLLVPFLITDKKNHIIVKQYISRHFQKLKILSLASLYNRKNIIQYIFKVLHLSKDKFYNL